MTRRRAPEPSGCPSQPGTFSTPWSERAAGCSPRTGTAGPQDDGWLDRFWWKLRAEAELRDVRLHDLRHTHASIALREGETRARHRPAARPCQPGNDPQVHAPQRRHDDGSRRNRRRRAGRKLIDGRQGAHATDRVPPSNVSVRENGNSPSGTTAPPASGSGSGPAAGRAMCRNFQRRVGGSQADEIMRWLSISPVVYHRVIVWSTMELSVGSPMARDYLSCCDSDARVLKRPSCAQYSAAYGMRAEDRYSRRMVIVVPLAGDIGFSP